MPKIKTICAECEIEYEHAPSRRLKFCSIVCSRQQPTRRSHGKIGSYVPCPICEKETWRSPSTTIRKCCSKKCANEYIHKFHADQMRKNLDIARRFVDYSQRATPEWRAKMSQQIKQLFRDGKLQPRKGSDSNFWKGGIASVQNLARHTPEYNEWRKAVYSRDHYTCQDCSTNKDLHAHHVKTFSEYPALRYVVENGITVCQQCHSKIHGRNVPTPKNYARKTK